jgi:acetylornithine deacetylase/succinyl-diaminopimelate desuccinylase-like protein
MSAQDPSGGSRALAEEARGLLQRLIRFDTVNPPGNERDAQEHLAGHLGSAGFECELLGAEQRRPNLVARLKGASPGPTLCLLGHVDTVLADATEWTHDPFGGEIDDGFLWGRGALDMKSQVAAEIAAGAGLARGGWRPGAGDLLIVAVVDEETGGELGAAWITAEHPEKVRCEMLVNEGGGQFFEYGGRRNYGVCCAEKGIFRFTITTTGVAGHASMPRMGENALLKMAPLLARLGERTPSQLLTPQARAFLAALGEQPDDPAGALARIEAADPLLATLVGPMLGVTFTPTKIRASEKINVIPSSAELRIDCRVPPGLGEREVREAIAQVLGDEREQGFEVDFTERISGNSSPIDSALMEAIERWIGERDPGAGVLPTVLPGFTDSRHFRAAFPDCVAYGFFPQRHQSLLDGWQLIHGADERIDVRDVAFASEFYRDLCLGLLGDGAEGSRAPGR